MLKFILILFFSLFLCACASTHQDRTLAQIDIAMAVNDIKAQDFLDAKAQLLQALQLDADDAVVQSSWGYYLFLTGDFISAAQAYQRALALAPDDPQIQDDYAVFLYHSQNYAQALKYFLLAAQNENYLYSALAYQNASLAAEKMGQVRLARFYAAEAAREGLN